VDASGRCSVNVDGVRLDTCGGAWRPHLPERGLTIFRRFFPVQIAADGLAAGGMHASRVCRGRVFGTTARLVCRPQAHLAPSFPRGLAKLKSGKRGPLAAPASSGGMRASLRWPPPPPPGSSRLGEKARSQRPATPRSDSPAECRSGFEHDSAPCTLASGTNETASGIGSSRSGPLAPVHVAR